MRWFVEIESIPKQRSTIRSTRGRHARVFLPWIVQVRSSICLKTKDGFDKILSDAPPNVEPFTFTTAPPNIVPSTEDVDGCAAWCKSTSGNTIGLKEGGQVGLKHFFKQIYGISPYYRSAVWIMILQIKKIQSP